VKRRSLIGNLRGRRRPKHLTPRQREVVQLLAEGNTLREAAALLNITPRTIAFHKYKVMRELGLKTSADLIRFAVKRQIVAQ